MGTAGRGPKMEDQRNLCADVMKLGHQDNVHPKNWVQPWLTWLSGLRTRLRSKGSQVRFPVRAHAWVSGQVPSGGCTGATTQ